MRVRYRPRFDRELRRTRNAAVRCRVESAIEDVKAASTVSEIPGIERMRARGRFYRIRVGKYRIGVEVEGDVAILVRFGHRSEIYSNFP
jgi:mRNA interferase RelE/StbE